MSMIIVAEDRFFLEDQRGPRIYMVSVDRTFARTEERKVKSVKREEYLRSKEEHRKRENNELASEEEITNMAAEGESNLEPCCAPETCRKYQTGVCSNCYIRVKCCT